MENETPHESQPTTMQNPRGYILRSIYAACMAARIRIPHRLRDMSGDGDVDKSGYYTGIIDVLQSEIKPMWDTITLWSISLVPCGKPVSAFPDPNLPKPGEKYDRPRIELSLRSPYRQVELTLLDSDGCGDWQLEHSHTQWNM